MRVAVLRSLRRAAAQRQVRCASMFAVSEYSRCGTAPARCSPRSPSDARATAISPHDFAPVAQQTISRSALLVEEICELGADVVPAPAR